MEPPLPASTPLLLVKPPVGLSTPAVFKALDLGSRSTADPQQLLSGAASLICHHAGRMWLTQLEQAIILFVNLNAVPCTRRKFSTPCEMAGAEHW